MRKRSDAVIVSNHSHIFQLSAKHTFIQKEKKKRNLYSYQHLPLIFEAGSGRSRSRNSCKSLARAFLIARARFNERCLNFQSKVTFKPPSVDLISISGKCFSTAVQWKGKRRTHKNRKDFQQRSLFCLQTTPTRPNTQNYHGLKVRWKDSVEGFISLSKWSFHDIQYTRS